MWQVRKTNELKPGFGALEEVDDDARVADTSPMQGDKEVAAENLDLKVELHRRLIDLINLSALEKMSRDQIEVEIGEIVHEQLALQRHALNKDER